MSQLDRQKLMKSTAQIAVPPISNSVVPSDHQGRVGSEIVVVKFSKRFTSNRLQKTGTLEFAH
jgi:hypothetical protein